MNECYAHWSLAQVDKSGQQGGSTDIEQLSRDGSFGASQGSAGWSGPEDPDSTKSTVPHLLPALFACQAMVNGSRVKSHLRSNR